MARQAFNEGWAYRTPVGPFDAVGAATAVPTHVTLPHDALRDAERAPDVPARGAQAYYPNGNFTYLKTFDVPADWAGRLVALEFQGAMRHTMVFVNDEFAGNHADGYARFFVDLTPFLRFGAPNQLRVEVRSGQDSRWYSGAGLHRPVILHVDEPVHITPDGVRVTTRDVEADQAVVEVATEVRNAGRTTASVTLATALHAGDGARPGAPLGARVEGGETPVTVPPGESVLVRQRFYVHQPRLWGVDHPHLYTAVSQLRTDWEGSVSAATAGEDRAASGGVAEAVPGDAVVTTFGIRTLKADPRHGLRINGETVKLRGACIHHDNGPLGGAAIARAEERRVELLRAAGFNAIRSAHNPASVALLEACDRHGMLVMDEAFDMWVRGKTPYDYALDFPQWWAADLASMVAKDVNHPSVIMYSIGNEIAEVGTPHGAVLARRMAEHVRALDPTRLVTNGVNSLLAVLDEFAADPGGLNELMAGGEGEQGSDMGDVMSRAASGENVTRRTAESHAALDVVGLNYGDSRYAPDRELFPSRVIVGSETFPSRIGALWPLVEEHSHVIGDFTWTGWDYLGEVGIGATAYAEDPGAVAALEREYPFLTAWCGDLDITGWRRPVSYYREIVFGLRTEPYIAVRRPSRHGHTITMQSPWAWSDSVPSWTWPGFEGAPITVEVYADADEVALLLDSAEVARGPVADPAAADPMARRPRVAVLEASYQPGELVAVAYRAGAELGRTGLVTAGKPTLVATADRTQLRADDADLAFVVVELRDAAGTLVTTADREVTVTVTGAGALAGMCSANPRTDERFDASTWHTFDGRALAVVRPTATGTIMVTVTAPDLAPVALTLEVPG